MDTTTTGRDWLTMRPAHFDRSLLSKRAQREADLPGLFTAADITPAQTQASKPSPELDGQADLFDLEGP